MPNRRAEIEWDDDEFAAMPVVPEDDEDDALEREFDSIMAEIANGPTLTLPPLSVAVERLARAVKQNSGGSRAAASVLLYGWNSNHPIRDLWVLDEGNRKAALSFLHYTLLGVVPDHKLPDWTGLDFVKLAARYGKNGTAWKR